MVYLLFPSGFKLWG